MVQNRNPALVALIRGVEMNKDIVVARYRRRHLLQNTGFKSPSPGRTYYILGF
ncbi:MAG: hypothetical protein QW708_00750 [Desulfurococcaceae archaeon]